MKQYIISALENGNQVILSFGKENTRTFDQLLDSLEGNNEIIELGQSGYGTSYLVNLSHVHFAKVQQPRKQSTSF